MENILSLAFSIHSNPGVYALLLGSGVSQAAGIPTGYEIIVDLVQKIAGLMKQECINDPYSWYLETFGEEPRYTTLFDIIAKTPAERSQLIKELFEPGPKEKEKGLKMPTAAHKAIAELVQHNYIKVIITTNFDQLLEKSLAEVGITPTIISSPDATEGALPLPHARCTILKVNGDYADIRIKNTPDEVNNYDERIISYLERIFDEYGLISCGWSAEWDETLGNIIKRTPRHRFSTYWATIGQLGEKASKIIEARLGHTIPIRSADDFFVDLKEKVLALETLSGNRPLSSNVAVTQLKKYLVDERYRINLYDLIRDETERAFLQLNDNKLNSPDNPDNCQYLKKYIKNCESSLQTMIPLMITGCYWGDMNQRNLWADILERVANPEKYPDFHYSFAELFPSLMLMYAGGIASIISERDWNVYSLLKDVKVRVRENRAIPAFLALHPMRILPTRLATEVLENTCNTDIPEYPVSEYIFKKLREPLKTYAPDLVKYSSYFNEFELLLAILNLLTGNKQIVFGRFIKGIGDLESSPSFNLKIQSGYLKEIFETHDEFRKAICIIRESANNQISRAEDYCG
jgi:hypothetical protein